MFKSTNKYAQKKHSESGTMSVHSKPTNVCDLSNDFTYPGPVPQHKPQLTTQSVRPFQIKQGELATGISCRD